jgi:hypothetical protein
VRAVSEKDEDIKNKDRAGERGDGEKKERDG